MEADALPEDWRWTTLGEVADQNSRAIVSGPFGSNIGSRFFVGEGVPVIRGNNLTTNSQRFIDDGFVFVTEEKADELRNCDAIAADLVFTAAGSLGQVGLIPSAARFPRYVISNKQLRARLDRKQIDPLFAFYWFSSKEMVAYVQQRNTGSSVPLINLSVLRSLPLPMPPLTEQRAIASILGALDDKIDLNRRMNETLEAMARALFKDWFVDFGPTRAKMEGREPYLAPDLWALFPDRLDEDGKPEGWEERRASDLFRVAIGRTPPRKEKEHFLPGGRGVAWLSIKTMGSGDAYIFDTEEDLTNDAVERFRIPKVRAGTVMVSFKLTVGRVAIAGRDMYTNEAIAQFEMPTDSLISSEFLYCALKGFDFTTLGSTSSIATAVNSQSIKSIPIVLPHTLVLRAFDDVVQPLLRRVKANISETRSLAQTRDLLLPKLMSGEIQVREGQRPRERYP